MDRVSAGKDEKEGSAVPENRKGFTAALHIRGLRQRWLLSATLPILLLLVLAVSMFSVGVQEYYYSAMRSGLESRARIAAETFSNYGVKSYSEYYRLASYSAETFEEKDTIELQFINTNGRVQVSSYGLTAGTIPGTSDIDAAVGGNMASYQGRDPQTGENILAVSYPLYFNSRVVGVLRYVTSLREAQHRVLMDSLLAAAAALGCMVLSFFTPFVVLINSIPKCVMGGACIALYGFIAVSGLQMLHRVDLGNSKNLFVVSSILVCGIGGLYFGFGTNSITGGALLNITSLAVALIVGIVTNLIVNNGKLSSGEDGLSSAASEMGKVDPETTEIPSRKSKKK